MECNCNNNNNGGVIPWVRGNRLPLCICIYQMNVGQGTVSTMAYNNMTRTPYAIQADDTVTVTMKSGFRSVEMPFTTDGNKVLVIDNGELPTGTYTVEVTIERGSGERGRWQESRQVRIYENTDEAILGEMYSIEADLFFWAKGDTGVGIANITSNPDDTLTITMTDGTTYTTQAMKGDKGDKGDQGERGTSILSFYVTGQTETSVIYTVTFSDDTTEEVAVPKGPQGDTGLTGNGISSTTLNSDYTLTIAYTDGTTYTTPSIRGAQGVQGVSIIAFTQTGETSTNTLYNVVFSDGRTQSVAIPKGVKGDKGDTGNTGPQGVQGPKGDTVIIGDEQEYTLYNVTGQNTDGAMTQKAVTDSLVGNAISYDNSQSGLAAENVQGALDETSNAIYKKTALDNAGFTYVEGVYIPSTNVWATHNGSPKNSCVMFPIKAGATYKLDIGQGVAYAILTSRGYLVGVTPQVTPQFADGFTGRRTTPKTVSIPRDSNAQYMYIATNSTQQEQVGTITELLPYDIKEQEESKSTSVLNIDTDDIITTAFIHSNGNWASGSETTNGAFVPVTAGKRYRISNSTDAARVFAWLQDKTVVVGESPSWATGNNARTSVAAGKAVDEVAPSDAAYLYIGSTGDLLTIYEIKNNFYNPVSNLLKYYNITSTDKINVNALTLRTCCIGSDNKWYTSNAKGRHKAIPVTEGEQLILIPSRRVIIGWLNNEYNPVPPYSSGSAVPFVTGRTGETVYESATLLEAPAGASYLCINVVDKDGNNIIWDIYRCTALNRFAGLLKFKYATWNVGHFAAYDGGGGSDDPTIPAEEVETMALRFKNVINDVSANVLNAIEYDKWFDAAGTIEAKDKIFSIYRALIGKWADSTSYYCCNAIFLDNSKFLNNSAADVDFPNSITAQNRYYRYDRCFIAGVETWFVAVHFEVGRQEYLEMQIAEMEQVIEQFSSCHHVVIAGDFNNHSSAMIQLFTEAGYTMANGGYLGWVPTSMAGNAIDNIAVKGFRMSNIQVNQESGTLSDHRLISCDLTLL